MINLKDITKVPELTALDGSEKVILNVNGSAHQANVGIVRNSEELDLDIEIIGTFVETDDQGNGEMNYEHTVHSINTFENIKNKILSGVQPRCKVKLSTTGWGNADPSLRYTESFNFMFATYYPPYEGDPEMINFYNQGASGSPYVVLMPDNTIFDACDDW